jgi:hypothetical protein
MKLDEFIFESIKQVIDGVEKAQDYAQSKGAKVTGENLGWVGAKNGAGIVYYDNSSGEVVKMIDFDVAVTTKEGDKTKAGAGLFVGPFNFGASGQSDTENGSTSRLKFSVPLHLPKQK